MKKGGKENKDKENLSIVSIGEVLFDVFPCCKWLGGAPFNFIYHINKLLGQGYFISRVGSDSSGEEILDKMGRNNISRNFMELDPIHPTGEATVRVDKNGDPCFTIVENSAYDFIEVSAETKEFVRGNASMLYFGSLAQRNPLSREAIRSLWGLNIKYFCDINIRQHYYDKEIVTSSLKASDVLKVNLSELELIYELLYGGIFEMDSATLRLMEDFHIELVCVTMGADGAAIYKGNEKDSYKASLSQIADTVGAGDAYSAILAIGYLNGWPVKRINGIATEFASGVCQIEGALPNDDEFYKDFKMLIGRR
ncbi:MAG: PfkB family carbohydrate kinase [Acidobacteriota bacterium]